MSQSTAMKYLCRRSGHCNLVLVWYTWLSANKHSFTRVSSLTTREKPSMLWVNEYSNCTISSGHVLYRIFLLLLVVSVRWALYVLLTRNYESMSSFLWCHQQLDGLRHWPGRKASWLPQAHSLLWELLPIIHYCSISRLGFLALCHICSRIVNYNA